MSPPTPSVPALPPSDLASWLAMPTEALAAIVAPRGLAAVVTLDGTRRWAFLHHPETRTDFAAYVEVVADATLALVARCFSLGIETVMIPALYPPNFQRGAAWVEAALGPGGLGQVLDARHRAFYERWDARARLFGTWRSAAPSAVAAMAGVDAGLREATPAGTRSLLWGCDAIGAVEAMLAAAHAVGPSREAVAAALYPDGPARFHFAVFGGWLRHSIITPPLLFEGGDCYYLNHLTLDLSEASLRAILHDHLVLRPAAPEDNLAYTDELLAAAAPLYLDEPRRVLGLGRQGPGGLWIPVGGVEPTAPGRSA